MPDHFIIALRRRLVELRCPLGQVRRLVREVAEHREDLKQAAVADGLSEVAAETRADVQLGDPLLLAEMMSKSLPRASWWGRHRLLSFGLLPFLTFPFLWLLALVVEMALLFVLGYGADMKKVRLAVDNPIRFQHILVGYQIIDYIAVAAVAVIFYWLARRTVAGFKWTAIACAVCSLYGLATWGKIEPHLLTLGFSLSYSWHQPWLRAAVPVLTMAILWLYERRRIRRFLAKEIA